MMSQKQEPTQSSGLPLRGLAMILIAVAVLLGAWAVWSLTGDSEEPSPSSAATDSSQITTAPSSDTASSAESASESPRIEPIESSVPPAPAPEPTGGTQINTLYVLNNSTIGGLAVRVADELSGEFQQVDSGNLSNVVLSQNTVYFMPGNPEAEQAARTLADRVGGIATEHIADLPPETSNPDTLVLVLVSEVTLG